MRLRFDVEFLEGATQFLNDLGEKEREKIIYNIDKSRFKIDPELFKKLTLDIWEFRTLYNGKSFRVFAFWNNTHISKTLIIATHGIIKKTNKTPKYEIEKAERIRRAFLAYKERKI